MGDRHYRVRAATADDAESISAIHDEGIADRATLETDPRTPDEPRRWLASRGARHPVIVAEADGAVIGWASRGREHAFHKLVLAGSPDNAASIAL